MPEQVKYRLTERCRPFGWLPGAQRAFRPKPADRVGRIGEGAVGGQTLFGLRQLALLLPLKDVAFWPFDGLNLWSEAYRQNHVSVEIYPSIVTEGMRNDLEDARAGCVFVRDVDGCGTLQDLTALGRLSRAQARRCSSSRGFLGWTQGRFRNWRSEGRVP